MKNISNYIEFDQLLWIFVISLISIGVFLGAMVTKPGSTARTYQTSEKIWTVPVDDLNVVTSMNVRDCNYSYPDGVTSIVEPVLRTDFEEKHDPANTVIVCFRPYNIGTHDKVEITWYEVVPGTFPVTMIYQHEIEPDYTITSDFLGVDRNQRVTKVSLEGDVLTMSIAEKRDEFLMVMFLCAYIPIGFLCFVGLVILFEPLFHRF